ncbi:hypothetical protein [Nostoc sp. PCC 9305]|uniref:hypothetical protein n=1 Tax=Nostoc sp. PCC 9305 TaxID=296636 RepID=UPI0039C6B8A4
MAINLKSLRLGNPSDALASLTMGTALRVRHFAVLALCVKTASGLTKMGATSPKFQI